MSNMGLSDVPVESSDNETLGLQRYATALTEFARRCQTPMTIALQGDWGSGKTSLMNLVCAELKEDKAKKYKLIWFNTWQYSQFGLQKELSLQLIGHFMEEIGATGSEDTGVLDRLKDTCRALGGLAIHAGRSVGGLTGAAVHIAGAATVKAVNNPADDPGKDIVELKKRLQERAKELISSGTADRIVVFIDDLDRLEPIKAVELLEYFKLFLDLPGCVFFLACDYQIVSLGLKAKLGADARELKGKSFFDKIIQLPFQMPVTQYDIDNYVERLLVSVNIAANDNDLQKYVALINSSIGFNPRNLKRAFNCLLLLILVAQNENVFSAQQNQAGRKDICKLIFACVCLQRAYEPLYEAVVKNVKDGNAQALSRLAQSESYADEELAPVLEKIRADNPSVDGARLAAFMQEFILAAKAGTPGGILDADTPEMRLLQSVLAFSGVTSASENQDAGKTAANWHWRRENKSIVTKLKTVLANNCSAFIGRVESPRVYTYQGHGWEAAMLIVNYGVIEKLFGDATSIWVNKNDFKVTFGSTKYEEMSQLKEDLMSILPPDKATKLICAQENPNDHFTLYQDTFPDTAEDARFAYLAETVRELFNALAKL